VTACQDIAQHAVTRASFPASVSAPAQYGTGIQALAIYLVEGQAVPYVRTSQLLQELLVQPREGLLKNNSNVSAFFLL
jgi:hypothetical protein